MKLSHRLENNICIVVIEGEIVLSSVSETQDYIAPFLTDDSVKGMILNFTQVPFIDSRGLGVLAGAYNSLNARQAKLALCGLSGKIEPLIRMTKMDQLMSLHATEEEAMAAVSG